MCCSRKIINFGVITGVSLCSAQVLIILLHGHSTHSVLFILIVVINPDPYRITVDTWVITSKNFLINCPNLILLQL